MISASLNPTVRNKSTWNITDRGVSSWAILGNIGVIVLPDQIAVPKAFEAFNSDGSLKDDKQQAGVEKLGATLATFLAKLRG